MSNKPQRFVVNPITGGLYFDRNNRKNPTEF